MSLYLVTSRQSSPYFLRRAHIYEPELQRGLADVFSKQAELLCMCRGAPGAPLATALGEKGRHPRRLQGTAGQHASGCLHSDEPNLSSALCAPSGSFTEREGLFVVNFDTLFPDPPEEFGYGGGDWNTTKGDAMLSLAWALIQRAGLNVIHRDAKPSNPLRHLARCASEVRVKRGPVLTSLESMFLEAQDAGLSQCDVVKSNRAKLFKARTAGHPLLLASFLPLTSGVEDVFLNRIFGLTATLWRSRLESAFTRYPAARTHSEAGGNVLVLALADAAAMPKVPAALFARVTRFALMPVTPWLTPLPTAKFQGMFDHAMRNDRVFVSAPKDDPLLGPRTSA